MRLRALSYDPSHNIVPARLEGYHGTAQTVERMIEAARGPRGERSPRVRRHAEQIVNGIRPKDYSSELVAVLRWWTMAARYTRDPLHVEMLKTPEQLLIDAEAGRLNADCDELATAIATDALVLGSPAQFVTVGFRTNSPETHTHVFARAQDPRTGTWFVLDPVPGRRVQQMLNRVKTFKLYPI